MTGSRRGWAAVTVGLLATAIAASPTVAVPPAGPAASAAEGDVSERPRVVRVVAAGDIACAPGSEATEVRCQHAATARLARQSKPDRVLALGDLQYPSGSLEAFRNSYGPTWGQLRGRTDPVPGNHEYETTDARGYFTYFDKRQPGPPGYYSRRYGGWRVFLLNTNCGYVDCTKQLRWFRARLVKHRTQQRGRCTLVAMHHPRYTSSSGAEVLPEVVRFSRVAYRRGVDLVISGHEHNYERFRRMDGNGHRAKDGFVQLVVGSGGASHRAMDGRATGSTYQDDTRFGVLRLRLGDGGYRHAFVPVGGKALDSGSGRCV